MDGGPTPLKKVDKVRVFGHFDGLTETGGIHAGLRYEQTINIHCVAER